MRRSVSFLASQAMPFRMALVASNPGPANLRRPPLNPISATSHATLDSGFVTLLAQDGVEGLQARMRNGIWTDVPPREGALAVNFGRVLERWTGGRILATEHRVLAAGRERFSIPFFYEPRADAEIAPLPLAGVEKFEPFLYGDHLWAATTRFVEFHGLDHLRRPRQAVTTPAAPSQPH